MKDNVFFDTNEVGCVPLFIKEGRFCKLIHTAEGRYGEAKRGSWENK